MLAASKLQPRRPDPFLLGIYDHSFIYVRLMMCHGEDVGVHLNVFSTICCQVSTVASSRSSKARGAAGLPWSPSAHGW